ncbi:MAG: hypothetical protein WCE61_17855 [Candidatus Acidiferrum sp.]
MKLILHSIRCLRKTESDEDEIYCVVTAGKERLGRVDVGNFEVGRELHPDQLIWEGSSGQDVTITVMESDEEELNHGSDDFIGEITVSADGNCKPGRVTLDEGFDESKRYRQFSLTGSGAQYVVQLGVQA